MGQEVIYWLFNYCPEGSSFGPASEAQVDEWLRNKPPYLTYNYHGYQQRVVIRRFESYDALARAVKKSFHIGS